jgi:hypothetical protein
MKMENTLVCGYCDKETMYLLSGADSEPVRGHSIVHASDFVPLPYTARGTSTPVFCVLADRKAVLENELVLIFHLGYHLPVLDGSPDYHGIFQYQLH